MRRSSMLVAALFGCVVGCQAPRGGSPEAWARIADGAPVRAAVFVDSGSRSDSPLRWLQLATLSPELDAFPVDAAMIRADALERADLLIMPDGDAVRTSEALGKDGRGAVRDFIRRGGGYIGTGAGCFLACQSDESHPDMLGLAPYATWCPSGHVDMMLKFNDNAKKPMGVKAGSRHRVKYADGPVMTPVGSDGPQEFGTVAAYDSDQQVHDAKPRASMAGAAAMIAGTYGKGRVFASAVLPETDPDDHGIVRGAFRFVTGRQVAWHLPQRRRGQLALGVAADGSVGVESARLLQDLIRSERFDLTFLTGRAIGEDGQLRHLDAVLVPDGAEFGGGLMRKDNVARTREFLARGGRIVGWGGSCAKSLRELGENAVCAEDGPAAVKGLEDFASSPLPEAEPVTVRKVDRPAKVAFYADRSGACYAVAETFEFSPEFELNLVSAADIRAGALKGAALAVQPGGGCKGQYEALQEEGRSALRDYVRGGGSYYGICAGAFLAMQAANNRGRLGLVPWKNDPEPTYRGWGGIDIDFTGDGRKALGLKDKGLSVIYWGGPVMVPGNPIEDADVKAFGTYAGRTLNTCQPKKVLPMNGKAAFLGGRVGKGKVFVSAVHPEKRECTYDIVRGAIRYLTGREAAQVRRDRVRGALSVASGPCTDRDAARFLVQRMMHDRRFDLTVGNVTPSVLEHADAVLLLQPEKNSLDAKLAKFVANGGTVIALADTPERATAVRRFRHPGATVAASYDEVLAKLVELRIP